MKIQLRKKKLTGGKESLYLEYYKGYSKTPEGKIKHRREFEFLNLHIKSKPKNPLDKQQNKDTLDFANKILIKRQAAFNEGKFGFGKTTNVNINFLEYFESLIPKRNNHTNWACTLKYLKDFCDPDTTFNDIDEKFIEDFKEFLLNAGGIKKGSHLNQNTVYVYYSKFIACLNQAQKDKKITYNPSKFVDSIKKEETKKEYLTFDEIQLLAKTECKSELLKRAFLFSCLTGLRWSDISKLKWSEIQKNNNDYRIVFKQKKISSIEYLDISKQASEFLGNEQEPEKRIFEGLNYSTRMNHRLLDWCKRAGISKHITFHNARHSFATLQITLGTDLYTVSKLLGHKDIKTTEVYAKIVDSKKKEAVDKIPDLEIKLN